MSAAKRTIDHQEIKRWVESHGGHPATVKRTRGSRDVGLIRIDFPGFSGAGTLEPIEWEEWFGKFDEQGLAFLYQEGKNTNFNKLVRRNADEMSANDTSDARGRTGRGARGRRGTSARSATSARSGSTRGPSSTRRQRTVARAGAGSTRRETAGRTRGASNGAQRARGNKAQNLDQWTKAELYERARSAGVPQRSTMSKAELVRALQSR